MEPEETIDYNIRNIPKKYFEESEKLLPGKNYVGLQFAGLHWQSLGFLLVHIWIGCILFHQQNQQFHLDS